MFVVKPKKNNLIRDYRTNKEPESVINMDYSDISDKNIQLAALTLNIPLYKYKNYSIEEIERLTNELTGKEVINDNNIYYKKIVIARDIIIEDKRKNVYNNIIKEKKDINKILFNTSNPNTKINDGIIMSNNNIILEENNNNADLNSILNKNKNKNSNNNIRNNINIQNIQNIQNIDNKQNIENRDNNIRNKNNIKINNVESTTEIVDYDILSDPRAQNVDRRILNDKFKREEDYEDNMSSTYMDYSMMNKQKRRFNNV